MTNLFSTAQIDSLDAYLTEVIEVVAPMNCNNNTISGLPYPLSSTQVATKGYVDSVVDGNIPASSISLNTYATNPGGPNTLWWDGASFHGGAGTISEVTSPTVANQVAVFDNTIGGLSVPTAPVTCPEPLSVTGSITATSATINGNETVSGTLGVTGAISGGSLSAPTITALTSTSAGALTATSATINGNETISGTLGVTGAITGGSVSAPTLTATTSTSAGALTATSATINGNETISGSLGVTGLTTIGGTNLIGSAVFNISTTGGSQNCSISNAGVPTFQVLYTGGSDNQTDGTLINYFQASSTKRVFNWITNGNTSGSISCSTVYGKTHNTGGIGWEVGVDPTQTGSDKFYIKCWSQNTFPLLMDNLGNTTILGSINSNGSINTGNSTISGTLGVTGAITGGSVSASTLTATTSTSAGALTATSSTITGNETISGTETITGLATFNGGVIVPSSNTNALIMVGPGVSSTTLCTGILQSYAGVAQGLCGLSFNGYFNGSDVRLNTTKNRWRFACDQRSTTDQLQIDYLNSGAGTVLTINSTTYLVNANVGFSSPRHDVTSSSSNPGGTTSLWSDTSGNLRWGSNYVGTGGVNGSYSGTISSTTQPTASALSSTFTLNVISGIAYLSWTQVTLGAITTGTNPIVFPIPGTVPSSWLPSTVNNNKILAVILQNNNIPVPGYLNVATSGPNAWQFTLCSNASWTGTCYLLTGSVSWICGV